MAQSRSHHHYGTNSHLIEHKWLYKLAIFSLVLLGTSVLAMFKLNNIASSLMWSVVFVPLWLGFAAWLYFIYSMIMNRTHYKSKAGLVPAPLHVIVLNVLWFSALLAFAIMGNIELDNGFPLVIRASLLFLPVFIASGLSLLAPVMPFFLKPTYNTYGLSEPVSAGGRASSRVFTDESYLPIPQSASASFEDSVVV
jgi:hypothetical protein